MNIKNYLVIAALFILGFTGSSNASKIFNKSDSPARFLVKTGNNSVEEITIASKSSGNVNQSIKKIAADIVQKVPVVGTAQPSFFNIRLQSSDEGEGDWELSGKDGNYTLGLVK